MKTGKKTGLVILAVLLVALLAGGSALYRALMDSAATPAVREEAAQPAPQENGQSEATTPPEAAAAPEATAALQTAVKKNGTPQEAAGPKPRANLAPVFNVYTDEGEKKSLIDLRGKPVIVNFFASWCGPCQMGMPYFDEAYAAYGEEIHFMMVDHCSNGNDIKALAKAMVAQGGWSFPVYFDTEGEAVQAYGVRATPTTIFVSADGELVSKKIGAMTREALLAEIDKLLAK